METTELMRPGFYWYFDGNVDPEVVQVNAAGEVFFCGEDAFYFLPSKGQDRFVADGRFVGPISPPPDDRAGPTDTVNPEENRQ